MASSNPAWIDPTRESLIGLEGRAAVNGQLVSYPMVIRSNIDPAIAGQAYSLFSFMLLKEPKKDEKTGKMVYGFFKLRGNYPDLDLAKKNASILIREHDSKYPIRVGMVGYWMPITDATAASTDMLDVRMSEEELHLRDQAAKDKQSEENRVMQELEDRKDQLKKDIYDDRESLDFYTMKRVTDLRLQENIDIERNKLKDLEEKLTAVRQELAKLEKGHPDYRDKWVDNYNVERKKSGITPYVPSERHTKEYEEAVLRLLFEKKP